MAFFLELDALSGEFVQLVDDGNRALLLTIGQEKTYEEAAEQLGEIATSLRGVGAAISALDKPPEDLQARVGFVLRSIEQFAVGYQEGADAASGGDVVGLNLSLATVSLGTGLMQSAAEQRICEELG